MEGSLEVLNTFGVSIMCRRHASDGNTVMFTALPGGCGVLNGHVNVAAEPDGSSHFCQA